MERTLQGALLGALLFFSQIVVADGIAVNPIRLELEPGQRTGSLNITNNSAETKVLQVTVMQWRQVAGESIYETASNLIATPVLFRMPPKGRQLVRVGFVNPPTTIPGELSYRVYLTEVPEHKNDDNQVRFLLRLGIPMFFPPDKAEDRLDWQLSQLSGGELKLIAENRGNRHVRLQDIRLVDNGGLLAEEQLLTYVLPGSRKEWRLTPTRGLATDKTVTVKAQSGRGLLEAKIPASQN